MCFRSADRPYISYDTFSRKLLKYPIFALQCSFWCPREDNFDKKQQQQNPINVTLEV